MEGDDADLPAHLLYLFSVASLLFCMPWGWALLRFVPLLNSCDETSCSSATVFTWLSACLYLCALSASVTAVFGPPRWRIGLASVVLAAIPLTVMAFIIFPPEMSPIV